MVPYPVIMMTLRPGSRRRSSSVRVSPSVTGMIRSTSANEIPGLACWIERASAADRATSTLYPSRVRNSLRVDARLASSSTTKIEAPRVSVPVFTASPSGSRAALRPAENPRRRGSLPQPGAFARLLGREKRLEQALPTGDADAAPVILYHESDPAGGGLPAENPDLSAWQHRIQSIAEKRQQEAFQKVSIGENHASTAQRNIHRERDALGPERGQKEIGHRFDHRSDILRRLLHGWRTSELQEPPHEMTAEVQALFQARGVRRQCVLLDPLAHHLDSDQECGEGRIQMMRGPRGHFAHTG